MDFGITQFSKEAQNLTDIGVVRRDLGIVSYRLADKIERNLVFPDLVGHHPEKVQRVRMMRMDLKNPAVEGLRLLQTTRLLVFDGKGNRFVD